MTLRPYQQRSHDAIMEFITKSTLPCVIEAATGAGKSHIIAALAQTVFSKSKKRILALAPSAELVVQNHEKYVATGNPASIFSASVGEKSLRHPVVFGTPLTVKNKISRFAKDIAIIILDEAHGITPTIKSIIAAIRETNPFVRVVGLTATPYRMGTGYIFAQWMDGQPSGEQAHDPYFEKLVDRITARELIDLGFLTQPIIGAIRADNYATLHLELNRMGNFDAGDIDKAFVGHGRKTSAIVADIVAQAQTRKGVMIFAATVRHAEEVMASLPPGLSAMVTGETKKEARRKILQRFKAREIKYLVNVSVLTTGFDAPHVDLIAIMRATESVGLLQQIIGRGLRIDPDKEDCLILDYAENIERHCPDGDIFNPVIKVRVPGDGGLMKCLCEYGHENEFRVRPNDSGFEVNEQGYFVDLDGNTIGSDFGPIPAHYGRRCQHRSVGKFEAIQCSARWTYKECPHCGAENDIAARYCAECRGEIVDPNEKLRIEFKEMKRDPTRKQTDEVLEFDAIDTIARSGNPTTRVDVKTPYRSFTFWVLKEPRHSIGMQERANLDALKGEKPKTITYQKDPSSGFYRIYGYNRPKDEAPPEPAIVR